MTTQQRSHSATTAQLRQDIDSGRTGDKIPVSDPAAAPLGTDDEAAGTPPSSGAIARAREQEGDRPVTSERYETGHAAAWLTGGIAALAVLIIVAMLARL